MSDTSEFDSLVAAARPVRSASRRVGVAMALLVAAAFTVGRYRASTASEPPSSPQASPTDTLARAPAGVRIRVRVLNTTKTRGLARRASAVLRDFGYDVVDYDSETTAKATQTRILSHTGHDAWAQRLRRAVGVGGIEVRADSLRHVDFTVLIGGDWKPPAQSFRP